MRKLAIATAVLGLVVSGVSSAYGAAALANGALTSCTPTSTNPALRKMQIAADPLGITDFQFTMYFEPTNTQPDFTNSAFVTGINGYVLGSRDGTGDPFRLNATAGILTVRGYFPNIQNVPLFEIDVFAANFILAPGVPIDTLLQFNAGGQPQAGNPFDVQDYMRAADFNVDHVFQGFIDYTAENPDPDRRIASSTTGRFSLVPEPGALSVLAPGMLLLGRRRQK